MKHKIHIQTLLVTTILIVSLSNSASVLAADFDKENAPQPVNTVAQNDIFTSKADEESLNVAEQATDSNQVYLPLVGSPTTTVPSSSTNEWLMAGANPQRTSWTPEEIGGTLDPLWYRPIEPYILPRVQIIAAYDTLYLSTANGLYALNAQTGDHRWVYPTEMPLGNSPTVADGVVYVGGFDHKMHAIDAITGQSLWTFRAEAGFDTNPLVVEGKVFAGNRDGYLYAIHAQGSQAGQLAWKFKTDGPINYSAAYQGGIVYFASNDSHAYALDADSGALIWKSDKLPGAGFHSWWPVVYGDWVIFAGSSNYRNESGPGPGGIQQITQNGIFPHRDADPRGTLVGPLSQASGNWVAGTPTIDASEAEVTVNGRTTPITEFLEESPWRRSYFVLNRMNGVEYTTDFDNDGKPEYAPILIVGSEGDGTRYPPIIGADGVLYQSNQYMSDPAIAGGQITGWQIGTPYISVISSDWGAVDEPQAYSAGGKYIYWNLCCDRQAGTIDISIPNRQFADQYNAGDRPPTGGGGGDYPRREWKHINYNLPDQIPGYNVMTYEWVPYYKPYGGVYGGRNGSYGWHGDENPPIPYGGKVYMIRSNAVIALSPQAGSPISLPTLPATTSQGSDIIPASSQQLRDKLAVEVQKIIDAGHLRPAWTSSGALDHRSKTCGDDLLEYWHHPGDVIYTLISVLPHLSEPLRQQTRTYIQNEFNSYPPYQYNHIGWQDGAPREIFDLPPDVEADMGNYPPKNAIFNYDGWGFAPHAFYAMWKYAEEFGGAQAIFNASRNKLESPPSDSYLLEMPHIHNAFIAGYIGYLELERLAGAPESSSVRAELNRLLSLRASTFSIESPNSYFADGSKYYCRAFNTSRNFMFMVPELAEYLRNNAFNTVQSALINVQEITPYWFVSKAETVFAEGTINHLYDYPAIFQGKAWILRESQEELVKYLDVPAFQVGDLFYIQNLVAALEAEFN